MSKKIVRKFVSGRVAPKGSERAYDTALRKARKYHYNYAVVQLSNGHYHSVPWLYGLSGRGVTRALRFKFIGGIVVIQG